MNKINPEKFIPIRKIWQSAPKRNPNCDRNIRDIAMHTALLFFLLFSAFVATNAQSKGEINHAMQNAESIMHLVCADTIVSWEQYSYLIPGNDIMIVTDVRGDRQHLALIPPGTRSLDVRYYAEYRHAAASGIQQPGTSATIVSSDVISVTGHFEAGKYYTFDHEKAKDGVLKKTGITVSVIEATDKNILERAQKYIASAKDYSAWSQAHPGALEGTYKTKNGKSQITFTGNKFRISTPFVKFLKDSVVINGSFWFNEETIIVRKEKAVMEVVKTVSVKAKTVDLPVAGLEILYYKLNNGILEIKDGELHTIPASIKAQYTKNAK